MRDGVISIEDPRESDIVELLDQHLAHSNLHSLPEDVHALPVDGLVDPAITFYWLSAMSFTVATGLIIFALVARLLQQSVPSWSSLMIVVSAFSTILILGLALAFEYLARIYEEVRARPVYLVDTIYRASMMTTAIKQAKVTADREQSETPINPYVSTA